MIKPCCFIFLTLFYSILCEFVTNPTPVVLWHGMGDSCCNPLSMGYLKSIIERNIPGVYVNSLSIGNNILEDTINGYFMNVNDQVSLACKIIAEDPKLQNGYNAIGFSQGSQFLRAVAQRCPTPPMLNYISIGGQHQGVYGLPFCSVSFTSFCDYIRKLLSYGAYASFIQNNIVQTAYWHDPLNEDEYREKNVFLADINQEKRFNSSYRENIIKLKNLVLVKFTQDSMVIPQESQWFGFYKPGQSVEVYDLEDSDFYQNDTLGLKTLDSTGRLFKLSVNAGHLQITDDWFVNNIIDKFLRQ